MQRPLHCLSRVHRILGRVLEEGFVSGSMQTEQTERTYAPLQNVLWLSNLCTRTNLVRAPLQPGHSDGHEIVCRIASGGQDAVRYEACIVHVCIRILGASWEAYVPQIITVVLDDLEAERALDWHDVRVDERSVSEVAQAWMSSARANMVATYQVALGGEKARRCKKQLFTSAKRVFFTCNLQPGAAT